MAGRLTVLVLAAGRGTRMRSSVAKVLHPVLGRPLLAWPLEIARALPAARRAVIVGHQAEAVARALPPGFETVLQEKTLGTGHAVLQARALFAGPGDTVVLSGDTPLLTAATVRRLLAVHRRRARRGELPHRPPRRPLRLRPRGALRRGARQGDRRARRRAARGARDPRGQRRRLLLREPLPRPGARPAARRQPPGGVLPHGRHRRGGARRAPGRGRAVRRPRGDARGQRPRAAGARHGGAAPARPRAADARRRHRGRPRDDVGRARRARRRRLRPLSGDDPPGVDRRRRAAATSGRSRASATAGSGRGASSGTAAWSRRR